MKNLALTDGTTKCRQAYWN